MPLSGAMDRKVEVLTICGRTLNARVDEPKGDPGNTLCAQNWKTRH